MAGSRREPSLWFTINRGVQVLEKVGEAALNHSPILKFLGCRSKPVLLPLQILTAGLAEPGGPVGPRTREFHKEGSRGWG